MEKKGKMHPTKAKKKQSTFGGFKIKKALDGNSAFDGNSMMADFNKASSTMKKLDNEYGEKAQPMITNLEKKVSILRQEKTRTTIGKADLKWQILSENYLAFVENLYNTLKKHEKEIIYFDLTGSERLTDAVFGCLLEKKRLPVFDEVQGLILTGCNQLTDTGIKWMSQCFPKLKEVSVDGCLKVTETGLYSLIQNCKDLKTLDLTATNVMVLPTQVFGKDVDTMGCPLISPSEGLIQKTGDLNILRGEAYKKQPSKNLVKVCIIHQQKSSTRIMPMITGEAGGNNLPINYRDGVKLKNTDILANVYECEEDIMFRILSKRSVVVVVYEVDGKTEEEIVSWLFSAYCQVIEKVNKARVLFLGLVENAAVKVDQYAKAFTAKVDKMKEELKKQKETLIADKNGNPEENRISDLDQTSFISTKRVLEALEEQSTQFLVAVKENSQKLSLSLKDDLLKAAQKTFELYPEYEELSDVLFQYVCSDKSIQMFRSTSAGGVISLEGGIRTTDRTMECLHYFGKLLYIDRPDSHPLIMDPSWFSKLLSTVAEYQQNVGLFAAISETSSVVLLTDIEKKSQEVKLGEKNPVGMLTTLDLGLASRIAFVAYRDLETEPPIPMAEYIGDESKVQQIKYTFTLYHRVSSEIMAQIVNFTNNIRRPIMLWKNGVTIVENLAQVVVQLMNNTGSPSIELLVQSANIDKGNLAEKTSKILVHTGKKFKMVVDYVLTNNGIPYKTVMKEKLLTVPKDIHGVVYGHSMISVEGGAKIQCRKCNTPSRQSGFMLHMMKQLQLPETSFMFEKNKNSLQKGSCVLDIDQLFPTVEKGENFPSVVLLGNLGPVTEPEISFTVLDLKSQDVHLELRSGMNTCLAYSFKTGELLHGTNKQQLYKKDQLGKTTSLQFTSVTEGQGIVYMLKLSVDGESQISLKLAAGNYNPVIVFKDKKSADMKCVLMVHNCGLGSSTALSTIQPGMKLEALDKMNAGDLMFCVATITQVNEEAGKVFIHFDGWNSGRYDYEADMTFEGFHPLGWFAAHVGRNNMTKYRDGLQPPNKYGRQFDWATYCEEENALPVPYGFFTDEQKGDCTEDEIQRVYDYLGHIGTREYSNTSLCSEKYIPGYYMESRLLKFQDQVSDELISFYSNHRQFLCLLPEKFDLNHLRFPSMTSAMNIEKQKVHFICPGHRMELLHLVDHSGLPLHHYMSSLTEIDTNQLYAYLEMIYMGLLVQPNVLPTELGNLCPGADTSTQHKMELLEMGFKRVFFQYLIWTYAYNNSSNATGLALKAAKAERSTILPAKVLKDEKSVASLNKKFHITSSSNIKCQGHAQSVMPHNDLHDLDTDQYQTYAAFMHKFELQGNGLEALPENFFTIFENLNELNISENKLKELPGGFSSLKALEILDISSNELKALPKDFSSVIDTLEILNISSNPFSNIPDEIFSLINLRILKANNIGHITLKGIGKLKNLVELYIASNYIDDIPDELGKLCLSHLDLSGIPWFPKFLEQEIQPNFSTFRTALKEVMIFRLMTEEEMKKLFSSVDKDTNGILDQDEIKQVNKIIYEMYPRLGRAKQNSQEAGFPTGILAQKNLESLALSFHGFTQIPDDIIKLSCLESLDVSHNPDLETLSASLGGLNNLRELHLSGCPSLKTPPKEIVDRGFSVVYGYLKRLLQGSEECKRTKLMVVGLGGAGKTSLIRALTSSSSNRVTSMNEKITDGIDITTWNVPVPGKKDSHISYSVWDFAGQTVYYNTHQFFLSNRACYLLLWNIRLGFEHAGLDFWLNSIACHAPKAPILVVGTHCDKVEKSKIPQKELMITYPQIAGFHFVSSYTGEGIDNMYKSLVEVTLQQKYMGEKIPVAWLNLENSIAKTRQKDNVDLIPLEDVKAMAYNNGILDEPELIQAVQFLHDLGSVQFFDTEFLRSLVVVVPQWIVDVMACVVTVHVGPIQEGKLLHKDMKVVWAKYSKELHPWLLRLTEEFDLTFPMADEEANLVPCLLPDNVVEIPWPAVEEGSGIKDTKFLYKFKYLPAGLFNRAQVRLHQFSESGQLWKKGMYLKKNNHIAVIKQRGQTMLEVKVQGFRPDNILFLVDEVISTLIVESYTGVCYDLLVPCPECQNLGMLDPSMFSSSKIYRALELNAPFLQCDKMFHVLSIAELKALIPPNKTTEFDDHLRRSVMELKDLGEDVKISVIFCYSKLNVPSLEDENKLVHPGHIIEDLRKDGFNVSVCDNPETADVETLTIAFKSAQVILFGASDEFCGDETCRKLLIFAKETLNKPILLVVLGRSLKFLETSIGLNIADEVFVKMTDIKRYEPKIKELREALKKKKSKSSPADNSQCFLSYCWSNSLEAISKGSAKIEGALGAGDPREIAKRLQENKVSTWLDIQRVGNVGLFDDIADGLKRAKVMVACVSDEYANSKNCKMEFRFAVTKLRIPTVLAVVGTGYNWERSEIGMLAVGAKCPKINFQIKNEAGYLQLFQEIQKYVSIGAEEKAVESDEEKKKNAFGEILESAERQFLRHLIKFRDHSYTADYPRLVVIDLVDKEKKQEEKTQQKEQVDETREANYCFSLLCESEEGWHNVQNKVPFPDFEDGEEEEKYLSKAAPYAARINSILKYSGSQMAVIATPAGKQLLDKLETHASTTISEDEVEKAYNTIIKDITELDKDKTYGGLKKWYIEIIMSICPGFSLSEFCCRHLGSQWMDDFKIWTSLLNGKTLWLCEEHRQKVGSITEQRYRTQLKTTHKDEPKVQKSTENAVSEKVQPAASKVSTTQRPTPPEQPKSRVFQARQSKSGGQLKRQTSQACSVM